MYVYVYPGYVYMYVCVCMSVCLSICLYVCIYVTVSLCLLIQYVCITGDRVAVTQP